MTVNANKDMGTDLQDPNASIEKAIQQTTSELKLLLERTGKEHALARYALGTKVNELEKAYGSHAVEKLAAALGRGYGADNLRIFARIANTWTKSEFERLADRGLDISDFRELRKVPNETTRARVEEQAIENAWPIETLKEEVRKAAGNGEGPVRTKKVAHVQHELPVLTVTDALNALITGKQPRVDEQARMREKLDQIDPQSAQALSPQINQAIEAVRAQRDALEATERLLLAALQQPTGIAA